MQCTVNTQHRIHLWWQCVVYYPQYIHCTPNYQSKALAKRYSQLKPIQPSWVSFGHPLGLGWIWSSSSFPLFGHLSQDGLLLLQVGDCVVIVRQLNGFLASRLDLPVTSGHMLRCKFWLSTWLELGVLFGKGLDTKRQYPTWYKFSVTQK